MTDRKGEERMCTAVMYRDRYFGRNLDVEASYGENVTVTPRNFAFGFRKAGIMKRHYAMIGVAHIAEGYPLYYDAVNEKGLGMAGLNFPGNAVYRPCAEGMDNIAPFELIPWILGRCADAEEARELLKRINIADIPFNDRLGLHPLHWIVAGRGGAVAVESVSGGLKIYDDPAGVLTNNPVFSYHMQNLNNYINLTAERPVNRFSDKLELLEYGSGMGAIGLPGDLSSPSRFVRAAFVRANSVHGNTEAESVSQFFHILGSVLQQRGCSRAENGGYEYTLYSSCCDTDKGIYYYKTYENSRVTGVDMYREDIDGDRIVSYPLIHEPNIHMQN